MLHARSTPRHLLGRLAVGDVDDSNPEAAGENPPPRPVDQCSCQASLSAHVGCSKEIMAHTPQGRRCASISECNACAQDRTHSIAFHTQHATHRHCKMQQCPLPRQVNFADNRSSRMDVSVFQVSRPYVSFTEIRSKCDSARSSSSHARSSLQYSSRQCSVQTDHHRTAALWADSGAVCIRQRCATAESESESRYRIASHRIALLSPFVRIVSFGPPQRWLGTT